MVKVEKPPRLIAPAVTEIGQGLGVRRPVDARLAGHRAPGGAQLTDVVAGGRVAHGDRGAGIGGVAGAGRKAAHGDPGNVEGRRRRAHIAGRRGARFEFHEPPELVAVLVVVGIANRAVHLPGVVQFVVSRTEEGDRVVVEEGVGGGDRAGRIGDDRAGQGIERIGQLGLVGLHAGVDGLVVLLVVPVDAADPLERPRGRRGEIDFVAEEGVVLVKQGRIGFREDRDRGFAERLVWPHRKGSRRPR